MDLAGIRILQAMGFRHFKPRTSDRAMHSVAAVAERVGLDQKMLRARLESMRASGFLAGFDLNPNLPRFGQKETEAYLHGIEPEATEAACERRAKIPGWVAIHDFFKGPFCQVFTCNEGDLHTRLQELSDIVGVPEARP